MDWAKATAIWDVKHLSVGILYGLYYRFGASAQDNDVSSSAAIRLYIHLWNKHIY